MRAFLCTKARGAGTSNGLWTAGEMSERVKLLRRFVSDRSLIPTAG